MKNFRQLNRMALSIVQSAVVVVIVGSSIACRPRRDDSSVKDLTKFSAGNSVDLSTYVFPNKKFSDKVWEQMDSPAYNMSPDALYNQYVLPAIANVPPALRNSIDKTEAVALYYYTANYYEYFNKALRHSHADEATNKIELDRWENIILAVASSINKQAGAPCHVRRGTSLRPEVLSAIKVDGKYVDRGFMSTTEGKIPKEFQKGVTFEIDAKNCRKISWISRFPDEEEVLIPPGTTFQVVSKKSSTDGRRHVIELKEVDATTDATDKVPLAGRDGKAGTKGAKDKVYTEQDLFPKTFALQTSAVATDVGRFIKLTGAGSGAGDGKKKAIYQNSSGQPVNAKWRLIEGRLVHVQYSAGNRAMNLWFYVIDGKNLGRVTKSTLVDNGVDLQVLENGSEGSVDLSQSGDELDIAQYYSLAD